MKFIAPILLSSLCILSLNAQKDTTKYPNYLMFGADYSSNTNTFGVTINEVNQPNYIFSGSFISKHNFDLNYAAIVTDNSDSSFTKASLEHNLGLGYSLNVTDNLLIYPSYTHLFHSPNSFALKSIFSDIAQVDAMYFSSYFNSSVGISHIWGVKNMFYITAQIAGEYTFEKVFTANDYLNIQLGFTANLSDKNYYNEYSLRNLLDLRTIELLILKNEGVNGARYIRQQRELLGDDYEVVMKQRAEDRIKTNNPDHFEPVYRITTVDINLPLFYSINNLMIYTSAYLTIPVVENPFYEQHTSFQFSVGMSYMFNLK